MKRFRALLVVLMSVAVPFTASASVIASVAPCASSQPAHAHVSSVAGERDCCDTAHAPSGVHKTMGHKTMDKSSPCKAGAGCKSCVAAVSMAFDSVEASIVPSPVRDVLTLGAATWPHRNPFGLWRPPRSV